MGTTTSLRPNRKEEEKEEKTMKTCLTCKVEKPHSEFHKFTKYDRPGKPVYLSSSCKPCRSEDARRRRYGTTLLAVIEEQGNICALCQVEAPTVLDHDHSTGRLRGAICRRCNFALHYLDDPEWRERAEGYIDNKKIPKRKRRKKR